MVEVRPRRRPRGRCRATGAAPAPTARRRPEHGRQRIHAGRVERGGGLAHDLGHRPLVGPRLAVRAPADQRVVHVADRHDAGLQRDRLAGDAVRVSAPAEPLVVPQHDRQLSFEPAQVRQQVGALAGMRLDHRELLVGEPARLVQDPLGHLQLADVVEQPGHGQTAQRRRRQAHLHAHPHRQGSHPPRVLAGGGIAQLHGRGHAADVAAQQALLGLEQVAALHPAVEVVGGHLPSQVDRDRAGHRHEADRLQRVRRPEHQRPGVRQQVDHDRAAQPDQSHGDREIGAAAGQLVRDEGPARDPEVHDADREQHEVHPRLHLAAAQAGSAPDAPARPRRTPAAPRGRPPGSVRPRGWRRCGRTVPAPPRPGSRPRPEPPARRPGRRWRCGRTPRGTRPAWPGRGSSSGRP